MKQHKKVAWAATLTSFDEEEVADTCGRFSNCGGETSSSPVRACALASVIVLVVALLFWLYFPAAVAILSALLLLMLGAIRPFWSSRASPASRSQRLVDSMQVSMMKAETILLRSGMLGVLVAIDAVRNCLDMIVLVSFVQYSLIGSFLLCTVCLTVGAVWSAENTSGAVPDSLLPRCLFMLALLRMLPLTLFLACIALFIAADSSDHLAYTVVHMRLPALVGASKTPTAYAEIVPMAWVKACALVMHSIPSGPWRACLQGSFVIGVVRLTRELAMIDAAGTVSAKIRGLPVVVGMASTMSFGFFAVVLFRLTTVLSGFLLIPQLLVILEDALGVTFGALILYVVVLTPQILIVWFSTHSTSKLAWAVSNLVSPVEPLLQRGSGTRFTCYLPAWTRVQAGQLLVSFIALYHFRATWANGDATLRWVFLAAALSQWPFLALVYRTADETPLGAAVLGARGVALMDDAKDDTLSSLPLRTLHEGWWRSSAEQILAHSELGDEGVDVVAMLLMYDSACTDLDIRGNGISDIGVTYVAKALASNQVLKRLNLNGNQIGEVGGRVLALALRNGAAPHLQALSLRCNALGDAGAEAFAELVESGGALRWLCLSSNGIGERGAMRLGAALTVGSRLNALVLNGNAGGLAAAKVFASVLRAGAHLLELHLRGEGNSGGDAGITALAGALEENTILEHLYLGHCGMEGLCALARALERRERPLQHLGLEGVEPDSAAQRLVQRICSCGTEVGLDYGTSYPEMPQRASI